MNRSNSIGFIKIKTVLS